MLVYKIEHTEDGQQYAGPINETEALTIEHISDILCYCAAGDTVKITVLDMTPEDFEALPEFVGY
jgi:hypothetical protein